MTRPNIFFCDTAEARIRYAYLGYQTLEDKYQEVDINLSTGSDEDGNDLSDARRASQLALVKATLEAMGSDIETLKQFGYARTNPDEFGNMNADLAS